MHRIHLSRQTVLLLALFAIATFTVYYNLGPRPSARYYGALLNKIGAPDGFTIASQDIRDQSLYPPHASTTYKGVSTLEKVKPEMLARLKAAGFHDIKWQDASFPKKVGDPNKAAGYLARCTDTAVFVGLSLRIGAPIRVELNRAPPTLAPPCPWL